MSQEVIFLSDQDVRSMLSIGAAMRAVEQDLMRQAETGSVVDGRPLAWETDDRDLGFRWRLKTVVIRGVPVAGVRIAGYKVDADGNGSGGEREATRYIMLSDPRTGSPLAIVDEHSSFGMRAAASLLVAARHLARADARVAGIIGIGNIGCTALAGLAEHFTLDEVRIMSARPETRHRAARAMRERTGLDVRACESHEEAVRGADIVVCATPSTAPYLEFGWLKEGVFVGAVGHDEVAHDVYARCDRFYVDYDLAAGVHPAHIRAAIAEGALRAEQISGELWQVVAGRQPRRRDGTERILVSTVGLTSQDVAIAYDLFRQARAEGRGMRLPFM
jgi:ornithine cyclodeaminase